MREVTELENELGAQRRFVPILPSRTSSGLVSLEVYLLIQRLDQVASLLKDIKEELSKEEAFTADWLPRSSQLVTLTTAGTTYEVVANLTGRTKVYRVQNTSLGSIYYGPRNPLLDTESPILFVNERLKFVIPNGHRLYMRPTAASLTVIVEDLY